MKSQAPRILRLSEQLKGPQPREGLAETCNVTDWKGRRKSKTFFCSRCPTLGWGALRSPPLQGALEGDRCWPGFSWGDPPQPSSNIPSILFAVFRDSISLCKFLEQFGVGNRCLGGTQERPLKEEGEKNRSERFKHLKA